LGNVTSNVATVTVAAVVVAPSITNQPVNLSITAGQTIQLRVTATGTSPTYQWRKNNVNIPGATLSTYTKFDATTADSGTYTVVVSNSAGNVTSNAATVEVTALVTPTTTPPTVKPPTPPTAKPPTNGGGGGGGGAINPFLILGLLGVWIAKCISKRNK
jgi:hypothetical protein